MSVYMSGPPPTNAFQTRLLHRNHMIAAKALRGLRGAYDKAQATSVVVTDEAVLSELVTDIYNILSYCGLRPLDDQPVTNEDAMEIDQEVGELLTFMLNENQEGDGSFQFGGMKRPNDYTTETETTLGQSTLSPIRAPPAKRRRIINRQ